MSEKVLVQLPSPEKQKPQQEEDEQTKCDRIRSTFFQRSKNGDCIIYDARMEMCHFKESNFSITPTPLKMYKELDQQNARNSVSFKSQVSLFKVGYQNYNEVQYQNGEGKITCVPDNDLLF